MPQYHQEKEIKELEFHTCEKCGRGVAHYLLRQVAFKKGKEIKNVCPRCDPSEPRGPVMVKNPPVGSNFKNHMAAKRARIRKRSK